MANVIDLLTNKKVNHYFSNQYLRYHNINNNNNNNNIINIINNKKNNDNDK